MKKYVLISGATGGLGKAMALECAKRGYNLYITDISEEKLKSISRGIRRQYDVNVYYKECELSDCLSIRSLWEDIAKKRLLFNMLINVAGLDYEGEFMQVDTERLNYMVRVNVESVITMTHNAINYRIPGERMTIINVSSLAAFYPMPFKAVYSASKRFLLNLSLALNRELRDQNIFVTALCPAGMPSNEEVIRSINSQGIGGRITTVNVSTVAHSCIDKALLGKKIYIPGLINVFLHFLSALFPPSIMASYIHRRWSWAKKSEVYKAGTV
jgi:short-subunit dehydrogenase